MTGRLSAAIAAFFNPPPSPGQVTSIKDLTTGKNIPIRQQPVRADSAVIYRNGVYVPSHMVEEIEREDAEAKAEAQHLFNDERSADIERRHKHALERAEAAKNQKGASFHVPAGRVGEYRWRYGSVWTQWAAREGPCDIIEPSQVAASEYRLRETRPALPPADRISGLTAGSAGRRKTTA